VRYNMDLTVLLFDNNIYGLTKMQSSPTTPVGGRSNTHPGGVPLGPINPLEVTLGIANASFVAQAIDWNPIHLHDTIQAAHAHKGLSFVRILQRCPHFMRDRWSELQEDANQVVLLRHADGIEAAEPVQRVFPRQVEHDPSDLGGGRHLATGAEGIPIGLLYHDPTCGRYDDVTLQGLGMSAAAKLAAVEAELDRFLV
jgi:2-oxoglutarate ferredoxin oxidoreductase subunit beta